MTRRDRFKLWRTHLLKMSDDMKEASQLGVPDMTPLIDALDNLESDIARARELVTSMFRPVRIRRATCQFCGLEISGFEPFRPGWWTDDEDNRRCIDGAHFHAPVSGAEG